MSIVLVALKLSAPAKTVHVELIFTRREDVSASGPSSWSPRFISSAM